MKKQPKRRTRASIKASILKKKGKKDPKKKCKVCGERGNVVYGLFACKKCRMADYELYRLDCAFDFDCADYPELFDMNLVQKYGWYDPHNNRSGIAGDHKLSVSDGFHAGIDTDIMKHPMNCKLLVQNENQTKNNDSSITLQELTEAIEKFNNDWRKNAI